MNMTTIQASHLTAELDAWCALQGLEPESVDEMLENGNLTDYHLAWLKEFANRWEYADDGTFWIVGRLTHPNTYTEQTTWFKSQEYARLVDDWGKPFVPEGFVAEWERITTATSWSL